MVLLLVLLVLLLPPLLELDKLQAAVGTRPLATAALAAIESAQDRCDAVNAPHLVALVRAGARFERGELVEREEAGAA